MKVKATYRFEHVVTREVDIDEESLSDWRAFHAERGTDYTDDDTAIVDYLNDADEEWVGEVFTDWRFDGPIPRDFELWSSDVTEVEILPAAPIPEGGAD